ncbi:MAG: hypothetical protein JO250_15635 [Armatimonadetes bacterium]|nr:hypothetical protein [Armatimonadota bacterium]
MDIVQKSHVVWRPDEIARFSLSVPLWAELATSPYNQGLVRHNGVTRAEDHVGPQLKPRYWEHADLYLQEQGDPQGNTPRPLFAFGTRNTFQNLGLPGFRRDGAPALLGCPDEPWTTWVYHALCKFEDGDARVGIRKVNFKSGQPGGEPDRLEVLDARSGDREVEWAIVGQPVLWDGEVPPLALLAACTYDLRHIWHLCWEAWQGCPADYTLHTELMRAFMEHLHSPIQERAAALSAIAIRAGLPITDGYLHSSIGITEAGDRLNLLMMNGSLTDLGYAHKALGSHRAILLDNGGSVGMACWHKRGWAKEGWGKFKQQPVFVGNGPYFRPRGHAVLLVELKEDHQDPPFRERPSGLAPWTI